MSIWMVIWVVLMMFWFFFGCWWGYSGPEPDRMGRIGSALIPFLCVLILGLLMFGAVSAGSPQTIR